MNVPKVVVIQSPVKQVPAPSDNQQAIDMLLTPAYIKKVVRGEQPGPKRETKDENIKYI